MTPVEDLLTARFRSAIAILIAIYACLQVIYVSRLPLVMDEFDGAYEAYRLRRALPYRDFAPYKTVLGYYVETIPTFLVDGVWNRIIAVKTELLLINSAAIAAASLYMTRFFRRPAIVFALVLLIACSNFLERSSELRVDMLTAWAGLASLLFLLDRRQAAAGLACGVAFLISQKGAFYFAAADVALAAEWLFVTRNRQSARGIVSFNLGAAGPMVLYVAGWSAISSPGAVIEATFVSAAGAAMNAAYDIWGRFWSQTLVRDPIFFGLAVIAVLVLLRRNLLLATYAAAVMAQALIYSQPWPYFFVIVIPTIFVLLAAFFDGVPMRAPAVAVLILLGVLYPLLRIRAVMARDHSYQRYNVDVASHVLGPGDTYFAGNDIVHDHEQALPALGRLGAVTVAGLHSLPEKELDFIADALEQRPPKLIIVTNRIHSLPAPLVRRIDRSYAQLTASIFSYAPRFDAGTSRVAIAFPGRYRLEGEATVNGSARRRGDDVILQAGVAAIAAPAAGRLHFMPEGVESVLDPRYVEEREFFPNVYGY